MSERNEQPAQGTKIRRRDLLVWGGAAAAMPAFAGAARAQELLEGDVQAAPMQPAKPMSVGFVVGSETWPKLRNVTAGTFNRGLGANGSTTTSPAEVVPAESLISGAQELANESVRLRVHGLYPIPNPTDVATAYLTVNFPGVEAGLPSSAPFTAWGYKSRPAPDIGAPISFAYPLGANGALELLLEVTAVTGRPMKRRLSSLAAPASTPGGRFATTFTVDWFANQPKLQRGVYMLALSQGAWAAPRTLPIVKPGQVRPTELLSLVVSFEPLGA